MDTTCGHKALIDETGVAHCPACNQKFLLKRVIV